MGTDNQIWDKEFILLGLSSDWDSQVSLLVLFLEHWFYLSSLVF